MNKLKRYISAVICTCIMATTLTGCGSTKEEQDYTLKIVTTIFPTYDWVKNIVGDSEDYQLTYLTNSGTDLHNYAPSVADISLINDCDLFIYVGGLSDAWVEKTLDGVINEQQKRLNLVDMIGDGLQIKETKEGMQIVEEDCCGDGDYDEHVWLSIKNAQLFTEEIKNTICQLDPDNVGFYEKNTESYIEELQSLDENYKTELAMYANSTIIFGDRFPMLYMFKDYNLDYYAAFSSCSSETEASFETVVFLVEKMNELDSSYIMNIDGTGHEIAETIISNSDDTDKEVLSMSSMENISMQAVDKGLTYISIMEDNLEVLLKELETQNKINAN